MEKIHGGYILQPRCWDQSDCKHFQPVVREVWFWILRNANHKDCHKLKRGQVFVSSTLLMEQLSWYVGYRKESYTKRQITAALRRLCDESMIVTTKVTHGFIATVHKYWHYQDPDNYEGDNGVTANVQRTSSIRHNNNKNGRMEEEKEPKGSKKKAPLVEKRFEDFWTAYPKKVAKGNARKAWVKLDPDQGLFDEIMRHLVVRVELDEDWAKDGGQFIPHAATWLNREGWLDEYKGSRKMKSDKPKLVKREMF